jgi:arsenical pump membrane protein
MPYLIAEFVAANTWSMVLVIGNPTNIYLAQNAGIAFFPYLKVMLFPTVLSGIVSLAVLLLIFRRSLSIPMSPIPAEVTFRRRAPLVIGLIHLSACTVLLAVSSYVGLEMWWISLGFSVSLALFGSLIALLDRRRPIELWRTLLRLPYQLIPFVLAMFALVLALRAYDVSERIFEFLSPLPTVPTYGMLSFLASNLLNNIPMSVLFSSVLSFSDGPQLLQGVYASIIGSNLGAYLTPLGALAGIMWSSLLDRNGIHLSFLRFVRYGASIAIPTLAAALFGLSLILA